MKIYVKSLDQLRLQAHLSLTLISRLTFAAIRLNLA